MDELITLLFQTLAALRRQRRRDAGTGLGPSHHMLLWRLKPPGQLEADWPQGPSRVSDLANALQLTPAAITQLVAELEGRGFVRRQRNQVDGRVVLVSLTEAGEEILMAHSVRRRAELHRLVSALDPEDRGALVRILHRLLEVGAGEDVEGGPSS